VGHLDHEIERLSSSIMLERFNAARNLMINDCRQALDPLVARLRVERVAHVRRAIERAINHLEAVVVASEELVEGNGELEECNASLRQHIKAQAIDQFTGVLLHELSPKLGLLRASAKSELADYEGSEVSKHISGIYRIMDAIKNLGLSAATPKIDQIDLHGVITDICADEVREGIDLNLVGGQPFVVKCDPGLLHLALSNGIRNAVEALLSLGEDDSKKLVISWGVTDVDCWVSILDEGPGLKGTPEEAFVIGATNKAGHTGFGLGVMKQAIESMEGSVALSSVKGGGARLLMRWSVIGE
jgi:signal transduction histidine kinase